MGHAVGGTQVVIKPGVDPGLHVIPAPWGVDMRCPSHRQGVHAVFVFQDVSGIKAVLAAGDTHGHGLSGFDHVVVLHTAADQSQYVLHGHAS